MPPKGSPRTHKFTMTMTDEEHAMLVAVAASEHRSAADWIRAAVREAHSTIRKPRGAPKSHK